MSRIEKAKANLLKELEVYKKDYPKTQLDIDCTQSLATLMNNMFDRISISSRGKVESRKYQALRKCLADYLLLLDNFDIKEVSFKSDDKEKI